MCKKTRASICCLVPLVLSILFCKTVLAEDIEVGHLETADDDGINWAFWACSTVSSQLRRTESTGCGQTPQAAPEFRQRLRVGG